MLVLSFIELNNENAYTTKLKILEELNRAEQGLG